MDKYQEQFMNGRHFLCFDLVSKKTVGEVFNNESLTIRQDSDITHTRYILLIASNSIEKIEICENGKYTEYAKKDINEYPNILQQYPKLLQFNKKDFIIELDFETKSISKIKLHFVHDFADPLEIFIEYVDADKEAYYKKAAEEKRLELIKQMNIAHSCGQDLVTIRFKNCCDEAACTKIALYDGSKQFMGTFTVEQGMFYKSITNLAYGKFYYIIEQFDTDGNVLVTTDYIEFVIKRVGDGNCVVIR